MILINLLPHREETRKRQRETFYAHLALSAIVGVLLAALTWGGITVLEEKQKRRNLMLETANKQLDGKIGEIAKARSDIRALDAKKEAVENLQADRGMVVRWMEDLALLTPEGVYLTKVVQHDLKLTVEGVALSYEQFTQFVQSTSAGNGRTITNADWRGSIKKETFSLDSNKNIAVQSFSLEFDLMRNLPEANDTLDILTSSPKVE